MREAKSVSALLAAAFGIDLVFVAISRIVVASRKGVFFEVFLGELEEQGIAGVVLEIEGLVV